MSRDQVLILDEEQPFAAGLARDLERLGYQPLFAHAAPEAFELACATRPKLIVSELRMPCGSALSLFQHLRAAGVPSHFVIVTAFGAIATAVEAIRLGVTAYLPKPVTAANVLDALKDPGARNKSLVSEPSYYSLERAKWEYINLTVTSAGSIAEAARRLRIERRSLRRMLAKHAPGF